MAFSACVIEHSMKTQKFTVMTKAQISLSNFAFSLSFKVFQQITCLKLTIAPTRIYCVAPFWYRHCIHCVRLRCHSFNMRQQRIRVFFMLRHETTTGEKSFQPTQNAASNVYGDKINFAMFLGNLLSRNVHINTNVSR